MTRAVVFAIALTSLFSALEATSRRSLTAASPELVKLCSNSKFKEDCVGILSKGIQGKVDGKAAVVAGLRILSDETDRAIAEAQRLQNEKTELGKASEELMLGLAVYDVVAESTEKALGASEKEDAATLLKEVKLASEVSGALLDIFQENVEGKEETMQSSNILIHKLAQINYDIINSEVKAESPASAPVSERQMLKKLEVEETEEEEVEETGWKELVKEDREEEAEAPAPEEAEEEAPAPAPTN